MKVSLSGVISNKTRNNYSLVQKLAIVDRARIHCKNPTARDIGIDVTLIHRWSKQYDKMRALCNKISVTDLQRKRQRYTTRTRQGEPVNVCSKVAYT
jgi:hypothetical protein